MNSCKNCLQDIPLSNNYCGACGALVVTERISIKSLFNSILDAFGWDSKFIITLRHMITQPQMVFTSYLNGTRKKYANPFALLGLMLTFSILIMSNFIDEYLAMAEHFGKNLQIESSTNSNAGNNPFNREETLRAYNIFLLKYQNIVSFVLIPFYSTISYLIYRKIYNYSEHLIINAYIISITTLAGIMLFSTSLFVNSNLYMNGSIIFTIIFYFYAFAKLYKQNAKQLIFSGLRFLGIFILILILFTIVSVIIGIGLAFLNDKFR